MTDPHPSDAETSPFNEGSADTTEIDAAREADAAFADVDPSEPLIDDAPGLQRAPVERIEPLPAAVVFGEILKKETLTGHMAGLPSVEGVAHPFGGYCKVCQQRHDEYLADCLQRDVAPTSPPPVTKLDVEWREIHPTRAPGWFAVNCCTECYENAQKDHAREERNREFWARVCPAEFSAPWDSNKADQKLLDQVLAFDPEKKRGLVIIGPTDSAKTRVVWQLLRKLSEDGLAWLFFESIDLLDAIPNEAYATPLLVIDDLGNETLGSKNEVRLLKLLRTRANWHRPTIITSQFNGEAFRDRFSDNATADAIIRRIRQNCDQIHAKPKFGGVQGISKAQLTHSV